MYNPYSLENKTILVTGASSGIGKATAIECAKLGATIVATGRNEIRLNETVASLDTNFGQSHIGIIADLSTEQGVNEFVEKLPNIDGLSSNAGVTAAITPIKFISQENANTIFNTNYFSHIFLAKMLFKKKKLNIGASIVFTASIGGISAFVTGSALYGSSKAALNSFTKFCAVEFASRKIRCNSVCPGMINTPMTKPGDFVTEDDYKKDVKSYLVGRYGEPEEIARTILFLLSDASSFITGASIIADGGSSIPH